MELSYDDCYYDLVHRLGLLESANRHLHVAGQNVDLVELQRLQNIEKHFSRCINARKLREWLNVIRESDAAVVAGADSASEVLHTNLSFHLGQTILIASWFFFGSFLGTNVKLC